MSGDRERIDEMLEIMREHDLDALTVRVGDETYELVRRDPAAAPAVNPLLTAAAPSARTGPVPSATVKKVAAPIIGVFYRAPAPGAEPFIELGDRVAVGQVLCILEAMKLMNEITTDFAGIVTRILPENGQLISLGEEMFWIEP
jgi:acetyl-CoA carboxylase biotin carboxyl carrier protein